MKQVLPLIFMMGILIVPIMSAYATQGSGSATGTVNIQGTCGVTVNPSSINFGPLSPGNIPIGAQNNPIVLTNTGFTSATLAVNGTDWLDGTHLSQITASNTKVNFQAINYTLTTNTYVPITAGYTFVSGATNSNWYLTPALEHPGFTGSLTQTLTFLAMC
jgi:hypothetical protein